MSYINTPLSNTINVNNAVDQGKSIVDAVALEYFTEDPNITLVTDIVTTTDPTLVAYINNYKETYEYVVIINSGTVSIEKEETDSGLVRGNVMYSANIAGNQDVISINALDSDNSLLISNPVFIGINLNTNNIPTTTLFADVDSYIDNDTLYIRDNE